MKFLAHHRKDVTNLIDKHQMDQLAFSYVKKKGRIHIIHESSGNHFAYLRKKETAINETSHQWEEKTYYKVQKNQEKEEVLNSWELVMLDFEEWLRAVLSSEF